MTEFSRAFRDAVARRYKGGAIRVRLPESLCELARSHLSEVLDTGGTLEGAARDLGVHSSKLLAWKRMRESKAQASPTSKLVPVKLGPPPEMTPTPPRFLIRTPSGVSVECTQAQAVAELLRCLG